MFLDSRAYHLWLNSRQLCFGGKNNLDNLSKIKFARSKFVLPSDNCVER